LSKRLEAARLICFLLKSSRQRAFQVIGAEPWRKTPKILIFRSSEYLLVRKALKMETEAKTKTHPASKPLDGAEPLKQRKRLGGAVSFSNTRSL
jgi:hypothetical protein